MTRDDKIAEVEYCCRVIRESDDAYDALDAVVGCDPDSPLWRAVFAMQSAVVKLTAKEIGDEAGALEWFVFENDCGRKKLRAGVNGTLRPIKTAADLVRHIEEA